MCPMWTRGWGSLSGSPGHPQILLEDMGQCTPPKSAWSHRPSPRPQAWPLLPSTELPRRKPNPEPRLDLCLALGPFQGTGEILTKKRSSEEPLTQSLRSLGTVRRNWPTQLSLPRALPWPPGPDRRPALFTVSLQAHVVLSFQAYPTAHCVLLEVQVPAALVQPGQSVVCKTIITLTTS